MANKLSTTIFYLQNRKYGVTKDFANALDERLKEAKNQLDWAIKNNKYVEERRMNYSDVSFLKKQIRRAKSSKEVISAIANCPVPVSFSGNVVANQKFDLPFGLSSKNSVKMASESDISKDEAKKYIEKYSDLLFEYVSDNNAVKNLLRSNMQISDYRKELSQEDFKKQLGSLFDKTGGEFSKSNPSGYNKLSRIVFNFLSHYKKEDFENNADFIRFDLQSGEFDKSVEKLDYGGEPISREDRKKMFETYKDVEPEDMHVISDLDLLKERAKLLSSENANEIENIIENAESQQSIPEKIDALKDAFAVFEASNRQEIVDSVFVANKEQKEIVVDDFSKCPTMLLHQFIRDSGRLRDDVVEHETAKIREENENTPYNGNVEENIQKRTDLIDNVWMNQAVVDKIAPYTDNVYSDASNIRRYRSNTQNQIAASYKSPNDLTNMKSAMGIGLDKNGLDPENIIMSSTRYITSNMGVDNIEVKNSDTFRVLSATKDELEKSGGMNEIVMFRQGVESNTNASYVFVALDNVDKAKDEELYQKSRELADKNNLPLVVIKSYLLQKQKQDMEENAKREEEQKEAVIEPQIEIEEEQEVEQTEQINENNEFFENEIAQTVEEPTLETDLGMNDKAPIEETENKAPKIERVSLEEIEEVKKTYEQPKTDMEPLKNDAIIHRKIDNKENRMEDEGEMSK